MLWQPMSWRLLAHSHMLGITSICLMSQSSKSCFALCQLMCFCFPAFNGWVTGPLFKNISIRVKSFYLPFFYQQYSSTAWSFTFTLTAIYGVVFSSRIQNSNLNLLSLTQSSQVIYDYKMKRFYKLKNEFTLPFINQTSSAIYEIKYK